VQADFAVELGGDDETLEMPWAGGTDGPRYYDLKRHPELLGKIEETLRFRELGEFLAAVNSAASLVETAKCDVWASTEINPEEEIFGAPWKFGSYVDVLFSNDTHRISFPVHEQWARQLTDLLKKAPEIRSSAELSIRRCYYHTADVVRDGFYITFYLFGYGQDEADARRNWGMGLKLVENALRQSLR
jgi:hypothetical protein